MRENRDFGQGLIKDYLIQILDYLQLGYCMYVFYVIYFFLVQGFINKNFNFMIGYFFNVYIIKLVWLVVGFQLYGCLCILDFFQICGCLFLKENQYFNLFFICCFYYKWLV